jgi:PAS domain S-box-containing protein
MGPAGALARVDPAAVRAAVDAAVPGICVERDHLIEFANPAFARVFGYPSAAAMLGEDLRVLVAPEDRERVEEHAQARRAGRAAPARFDFRGRRLDGETVWLESTAAAVVWGEGTALVRTVVDVTERRRLEEQLLRAQKMEAVGRLAGGVAHDFNNLLTVILGRAELLLSGPEPDPARRRELELIYTTAARGTTLIQQLLGFARREPLEMRPVHLGEVVQQLLPMLRQLIGEHVEVAASVAPASGWVSADPSQLEQVVVNLVVNGRDAMPDGGVLTLEVADVMLDAAAAALRPGLSAGPHVVLSVRDTGVGMDAPTRQRIFEPFFTTKPAGQGTGLGLATVYAIVRRCGGWIEVDSAPGQGSVFRCLFPRVAAGTPAEVPDLPADPPGPGAGTVLVVEDDEGVRLMAADALRMCGYEALEAADPDEALRIAAEPRRPIDVVVTDVIMPRMNGLALVGELRRFHPAIRALYISGYGEDLDALRGLLASGAPFLQKPFTVTSLSGAVAELLDAPGREGR